MGQILVRKLSDDLIFSLRRQADHANLPLEAYVRSILEKHANHPTNDSRIDARRKLEAFWEGQNNSQPDSIPEIRAMRENP